MVRRAKGEGSIRYDNRHDRYIWRLKFLGEDGLKHEKYLTAKTKKGLQEKIKEYKSSRIAEYITLCNPAVLILLFLNHSLVESIA